VGGGWGMLCLDPPPEKILSLDPPFNFFLAKNGKVLPKNGN
jgi:hypothetical protein